MTEEERMNEYALGAYRAAMLARGRVPELWSQLGSRRRRSWRAAARTVLRMHTRESLGLPLLAPLGLVEDRTPEQLAEDGDDHRDPLSGAPLPRVFIHRRAWEGHEPGSCCLDGRCDGPVCACPCHPPKATQDQGGAT